MICRKCGTENPDSSVYCSRCGIPIFIRPARPKKTIPWYVPLGGVVILLLGSIIIYMMLIRSKPAGKPGRAEKEETPSAVATAAEKAAAPLTWAPSLSKMRRKSKSQGRRRRFLGKRGSPCLYGLFSAGTRCPSRALIRRPSLSKKDFGQGVTPSFFGESKPKQNRSPHGLLPGDSLCR